MECLGMTSAVEDGGTEGYATAEPNGGRGAGSEPAAEPSRPSRTSVVPRSQGRPGMGFGHDVLVALIMAVAMAATVFLYR
jgi:hypothetical protein